MCFSGRSSSGEKFSLSLSNVKETLNSKTVIRRIFNSVKRVTHQLLFFSVFVVLNLLYFLLFSIVGSF